MDSFARNQATIAQIQRLEDAPINPVTGKEWPKSHDNILQGRRKLPVYKKFEEILDAYHQNQVLVLSSETGAGKSTQVPQLLMYDEYASGLRIACTQPRRLAATSLAGRVSMEMGVELGEEVGYQIGGDKKIDQDKKRTRLAYMTEGVLLTKQVSDKNLNEYACIIIDEAHERTMEADTLLALLKRTLRRRKDLKLIIMSATMDAARFQAYFDGASIIEITGTNFQVAVRYLGTNQPISDLNTTAARLVIQIHQNDPPGDILVFLPGQGEIDNVCQLLREHTKGLDIFPLFSALSHSHQKKALMPSGQNRKCIVATNIAETSLTIDGIVYVIDSGLSRQMFHNPRNDASMLRVMPISQASAKQRTGRAGRTSDGVCYRLYSKRDFDCMEQVTKPAIHCASVHTISLKLLMAGYVKLADFDWLDAPFPESLARAAQDLRDWSLIQENGKLNKSGRFAAMCPVDPIWFRAIEEGAKLNCSVDIVDIAAACTSNKDIFGSSYKYQQAADISRGGFAVFSSDHIALANALNFYLNERERHKKDNALSYDLQGFCNKHFLDLSAMEEARKARHRIWSFLINYTPIRRTRSSAVDKTNVRKALAIAFSTQTAIYHPGVDEYRTVHENVAARLAPTSSLLNGRFEWIVYNNSTMSGSRTYLEIATAINAEWLVDLPYFKDD